MLISVTQVVGPRHNRSTSNSVDRKKNTCCNKFPKTFSAAAFTAQFEIAYNKLKLLNTNTLKPKLRNFVFVSYLREKVCYNSPLNYIVYFTLITGYWRVKWNWKKFSDSSGYQRSQCHNCCSRSC